MHYIYVCMDCVDKITERSAHKYNLERTIPNVMDISVK